MMVILMKMIEFVEFFFFLGIIENKVPIEVEVDQSYKNKEVLISVIQNYALRNKK